MLHPLPPSLSWQAHKHTHVYPTTMHTRACARLGRIIFWLCCFFMAFNALRITHNVTIYGAPGTLYEVNGRHMHLYCTVIAEEFVCVRACVKAAVGGCTCVCVASCAGAAGWRWRWRWH